MFDENCRAARHLLLRRQPTLTENEHALLVRLEVGDSDDVVELLKERQDLEGFRAFLVLADPVGICAWWKAEQDCFEEQDTELLLQTLSIRVGALWMISSPFNEDEDDEEGGGGFGYDMTCGLSNGNGSGDGPSNANGDGYGNGYLYGDGEEEGDGIGDGELGDGLGDGGVP